MKAIADKNAALAGRAPLVLSPCKGKFLSSNEPVDCIRLLMNLIT